MHENMAWPHRSGSAARSRWWRNLGGYRDRKHDPDPGNQILWTDYNRLTSAVIGHEIGSETGFKAGKRHALRKNR